MSKFKKKKDNMYTRPQSVCVVVYDMSGAPIADSVAEEIADSITHIAQREKYAVNVTRA
jgi:hypothetical protein